MGCLHSSAAATDPIGVPAVTPAAGPSNACDASTSAEPAGFNLNGGPQHAAQRAAERAASPGNGIPASPFIAAAAAAAAAVSAAPRGATANPLHARPTERMSDGPYAMPMADMGSSHCSSAGSSYATVGMNGRHTNQPPTPLGQGPLPSLNGSHAYTAQALGPSLPGGGGATMSARPEELLMGLGQLGDNMGLMARPASLQLHQLNRQITNLQKIGQGAGGIVYRGLWTGVNVAIKFLRSSSPDQLNQTAKEAILSRFVSHPNVVQTYTYDVTLLVDSAVSALGQQAAQQPAQLQQQPVNGVLPIGMPGIQEEDGLLESASQTRMAMEQPDPDLLPDSVNADAAAGGQAAAAPVAATAASVAALQLQQQQQHQVTTPSLAIFDICSKSTVDVRASIVSQPDVDSMMGAPGWDMQDVLLRLGAQPGEYLTHIIMELCDSGTLQQAIGRGIFGGSKESSSERAKCRALIKSAREVAAGMQHLHSLGIIHGDLKPGNVLLRKDASSKNSFVAKVGDFGLAQRCIPGAPEVQHGVPLGTLCYAAPEALRGVLLKTSDVYSFGVMLWQMCTGTQPFNGLHPAHILYGKQTGTLKLAWPPEVYSPIRKLAELCVETDPAARPHFDQVCKALVQIEQRLQKVARAPPSTLTAAQVPPSSASGPAVEAAQPDPVVYELMPDPELL